MRRDRKKSTNSSIPPQEAFAGHVFDLSKRDEAGMLESAK
jgi:hypothetical protein